MLLKLFLVFVQIGLFSVGGGYASMPLVQSKIVGENAWLTMSEFADIVTVAEMTPGPIAINAATFVGARLGGIPGALVATAGCVFAPVIIVFLLSVIYCRYRKLDAVSSVLSRLRPAIVAMIASAGLSIISLSIWNSGLFEIDLKNTDIVAALIFAAALFLLRTKRVKPVFAMLSGGVVALVAGLIT